MDVSTSAQATIGGMAGNNSCGSRSIRYGNMVHNVLGIEAWLPSGDEFSFGPGEDVARGSSGYRALIEKIHAIAQREAAGDRGALAEGAAPGAGLQPRHGAARGRRTIWRTCWWARKARSRISSACG